MEGGNSTDSRDKWNIQRLLEEVARDPGLEGPACKHSTWRHKTPLSSHVFVLRFSPQSPLCWGFEVEKRRQTAYTTNKERTILCIVAWSSCSPLRCSHAWPGGHPSIHSIVTWRQSPRPPSIHSFRVSPAPAFLGEPLCPERTGGEDPTFQQWLWEVYRTVRICGTFLWKQQSVYAVLVEVRRGDIMVVA